MLLDTRKVVIEKIEGCDDAVVVNEGKEEEDEKMAATDASAKAATAATPEETPSIPTTDRKITTKLLLSPKSVLSMSCPKNPNVNANYPNPNTYLTKSTTNRGQVVVRALASSSTN